MTRRGSLRQLLKTRSRYGELPQHLASYAVEELRALRGGAQLKGAVEAPPPAAAGFLKLRERHVERSAEDIESSRAGGEFAQPRWDQTLRLNTKVRARLLQALYRARFCSVRRTVKARAGLFFAREKDGHTRLA